MKSRLVHRLRRGGQPPPDEALLLTAKTGKGAWINAAALVRPRDRRAILALIMHRR